MRLGGGASWLAGWPLLFLRSECGPCHWTSCASFYFRGRRGDVRGRGGGGSGGGGGGEMVMVKEVEVARTEMDEREIETE